MEFLKTILYLVILAIIALVIYTAMRPNTFRLERSTHIKAPPEKVFALVNDFRNWNDWSPWDKIDPNLNRTFSGASEGAGSKYAWAGNKKVGEGNMAITRSDAPSAISLDLNFLKPFKASNVTDFTFTPQDGGTQVVWAMHGPLGLVQRIMHIFFSMEKMVGPDFEKGLASMKALAEK